MLDSLSPGRSDLTRVLNSQLGPNVAAQHVLVREGTTGGLIASATPIR